MELDLALRARAAKETLRNWLSREYKSVDSALAIFDLDSDGVLSWQELARAASQAGVADEDIPALLASLELKQGIFARTERIADLLLGRMGVSPINRGVSPQTASALPVVEAPGERLLQVVKQATEVLKSDEELKSHLFALLNVSEAPVLERREERQKEILTWLSTCRPEMLLEATDAFGSSALLLSARLGFDQVCRKLLSIEGFTSDQLQTFVNKPNEMGWTPLLLAAQNGYSDICLDLLKSVADPNISTGGTRLTPLMLAASNGHTKTVDLLLDTRCTRPWTSQADPWRTTTDGRTALDFARSRIKVQSKLASDWEPGEKPELDSYGVRRPLLSDFQESYGQIERILLDVTKGSTHLGNLRLELMLGTN